jgi:hypothetical protein
MIFVASAVFSQKIANIKPVKSLAFIDKKPVSRAFQAFILPAPITAPVVPVQANYYAANLGFFCKQEIKFEKFTKIPFKFRLGSVAQTDELEGKNIHRP